ncbi:MAG: aminotransferase class I/II-fold pyridoxal phosphate-dependent enzyme [Prevotellaceae bacterium]|jgi:aspartate/methionine/tyrosine aminotransferase|nr:aminotransferase class I/II-fold pyridoxal phosphate-dependent enzyme [Prevotellaceae bacterium]
MKITPFALERYFAKHEFTAPYLLCCSDCEALTMSDLLTLADESSLRLWQDLKLGYTESMGHPLLREEIVQLYDSITPNEVLVTVPEEGIYIAMNNLLQQGDHIVVTGPGYQSLSEVATSLGCNISFWMPKWEERNGWQFKIEDMLCLVTKNTKLIVINFPHNPTGCVLCEAEMNKVVEIARERNMSIFSDEMYRYLEHDPSLRLPSVAEIYEKGIALSGLSKSFALPGLRIGWLISKDKTLLQSCAYFKDYTTICSSAPSEVLGLIGLRAKEQILKRNIEIISKNLNLLDTFFNRYAHLFAWHRPLASTIALPKLLINKPVTSYCDDLIEKSGVMLLPAPLFGLDDQYFRIGFGRKNLPEALARWEAHLC